MQQRTGIKKKQICFSLDNDVAQRLTIYAAQQGSSVSETVAVFIKNRLESNDEADLFAQMVEEVGSIKDLLTKNNEDI